MHNFKTLLVFACLAAWLAINPGNAEASAPPNTAGAEQCVECHEAETNIWLNSPHALASESGVHAATCEGCHGDYVEDHPDAGIMQLTVDSSACQDCHESTFGQWEGTIHADAGVQCIGCHLSHSQEFRLSDNNRCGSCHRERQQDFSHSAHGLADVACVDCHVTQPAMAQELAFISTREQTPPDILAPDHDFTAVPDASCIKCHTEEAHTGLMINSKEGIELSHLVSTAERTPILAQKLNASQQLVHTLQVAAPVALGLGISLGAALGIGSFMLFCHYNQRRSNQ
jgi:hypothetical protein